MGIREIRLGGLGFGFQGIYGFIPGVFASISPSSDLQSVAGWELAGPDGQMGSTWRIWVSFEEDIFWKPSLLTHDSIEWLIDCGF